MLGNFFVLAILKTNPFSHHLSAISFEIWTFSAFLYISGTTPAIFLKSLQTIVIICIIVFETFIKIDSLQHLESARQTCPIGTC